MRNRCSERLTPPMSGGHPPSPEPRAVLGLPLDATKGEAQRAFRRLAKQTHPDAGGNAADFRAVQSAWSQLSTSLPPSAPARQPVRPSPHVRAYEAAPSRVVWAEPRRTAPPVTADFAAVLQAQMARLAA
jgi:hypothetical protein